MTMNHLEANAYPQSDTRIESAAQQLRQIISEARRRHASNLSGADIPPAAAAAFYDIQRHMIVREHWDINWPPGLLPKAAALYHKIIRRLLRWYIKPIVSQQNEFNLATLRAIQAILSDLQGVRAEQQARLSAMTEQLAALERTLAGK
ncbi:MAG: hypothetical protein HY870_20405 [Chloroflexi bacterium]|nr:hypothetical protein [Chloroflexota bacterium]